VRRHAAGGNGAAPAARTGGVGDAVGHGRMLRGAAVISGDVGAAASGAGQARGICLSVVPGAVAPPAGQARDVIQSVCLWGLVGLPTTS
jgi:hypothetical protein